VIELVIYFNIFLFNFHVFLFFLKVALVFPNNDPINFAIAFCGCLMAGLVTIPIDVPLVKRDAGCQNLGFLLGQVGATTVLTTEICYKGLPKNPNNENVEFKGNFSYCSIL
jgi:acyl-CoA synthetase (AMP-forming)/AMP-acid ligase II